MVQSPFFVVEKLRLWLNGAWSPEGCGATRIRRKRNNGTNAVADLVDGQPKPLVFRRRVLDLGASCCKINEVARTVRTSPSSFITPSAISRNSLPGATGRRRSRDLGRSKGDSIDNALAGTVNGLYKPS